MAILESLTIDSLFQTKLMGVDQILQYRPNFTILEYLEYLEYLDLGQFRNFCDVWSKEATLMGYNKTVWGSLHPFTMN